MSDRPVPETGEREPGAARRWTIRVCEVCDQALETRSSHVHDGGVLRGSPVEVVEAEWETAAKETAVQGAGNAARLGQLAAEAEALVVALEDLVDWAENLEGEGRLRRIEALENARAALANSAVREEPE